MWKFGGCFFLFILGSPQLLYQRPYDPIIIPAQNQQFGIATNPIGLSQPSYAPPRVVFGGQQKQMAPGPYMFRQALARVSIIIHLTTLIWIERCTFRLLLIELVYLFLQCTVVVFSQDKYQ
jgi:hypothetical protein